MRLCEVCEEEGRKRAMTNGVRHLHELEEGEVFVDSRGRARRVVKKSRGRVEVSAGMTEGETVEFERFDGTPVSFDVAPSSATEDWSETALVRPFEEGRPERAC